MLPSLTGLLISLLWLDYRRRRQDR